jgi:hypothetical protein
MGAAEAGIMAVREQEKRKRRNWFFCKVRFAFRRSSRGCKRAAEEGILAVKEKEKPQEDELVLL